MQARFTIAYDLETDGVIADAGKQPQWEINCGATKKVEDIGIVQLAAVPIDMRNFRILEEEKFCVDICPTYLEKWGETAYYYMHEDVIGWHAKNLDQSTEAVLERWKSGLKPEQAIKKFVKWTRTFIDDRLKTFRAGANNRAFDDPILDYYLRMYSNFFPFDRRDSFDLLHLCIDFFTFAENPPENYQLDTILQRFKIERKGKSHEAMSDVICTAQALIKFFELHKNVVRQLPVLNGR